MSMDSTDLPPDLPAAGAGDQEVVSAISELTEGIVHDARNLIFPLLGQIELAIASVVNDTADHQSLLALQSTCRRCQQALTELAEVATRQSSEPSVRPAVDHLAPVERDSTTPMEPRLTEARAAERVAIIDSNPMMRDLVKSYLAEKGYVIAFAGSVDDARKKAEVIADWAALLIDGDLLDEENNDWLAELRRSGMVKKLIVSCASRNSVSLPVQEGLRLVQAPYRLDELAMTLRGLLDED